MFDYKEHFNAFCKENNLCINLSFDMPAGYECANGTFDDETKTVCINAEALWDAPDHEKAFYLFHELRHAMQYLCPGRFSEAVRRSLQYVIQYDGTCYKRINGAYRACRLDGGEKRFADLYLAQPHETDANAFAYERTKRLFGDSAALRKLYTFWTPERHVSVQEYDEVFAVIDEKTEEEACGLPEN